ncbi:MAG: PAS domain-containing protein, partial [Alphaproteobacteria bacterium]|nr:PAS domain-containing protein [Alphaproteobacteria bacterium]
ALAIFDRDLNYLALSRQWREDFGLGNGDYIGECQYDVMPETRLHWTHRFERCLIGETLSSPGAVLVRKDGKRQSVSWELRPWMDDAGRIGGVVMITRTLAHDEARQSARLRDIAMDSALSPLAMLNIKGEITYANQAFAELVGAESPKEVTGIRGDEFWRPQEDGADVWTALIDSGKWIGTTDLRRFDGGIRSVQITANLIHDEKQQARGVIASLVDITEQKRTEAALSETERRLATVIESLPGGVVFRCRHDACLTMELLSGSTKDLFGFPAEAIIGNRKVSFSSLIFSDDQARVHREIGDALADGRSFHVIYRIRTKDGAVKWMLQQGNPLFSEDGGVDALEGVIIDITAQVTAEHTIRQEKERAEQYLDVAASIILALDQRGRVTLFNRKGMEVCGYSEQELLGKNWFDVMHLPENRLEAKSEFHQMIRQDADDPIYLESEIRTKSGEQKFIGWTLNRIRDERGDVNGLLGSGEDL